jgi:hypothetical protein
MLRAIVLIAVAVASPATARAATAAEQIAALNAQRAANGIPAGIVEQPDWTRACRDHMAYIAANGGTLTHDEQPGNPGYSADGAWAGPRSVLAPDGDAFGPSGNAFESAPLHLMQTLAPALSQIGVWGGCATTGAGAARETMTTSLFTYPGDASADVARSETAAELPFVPGDFAGLAQGTTTGVHLLVMSLGTASGRLTSATLSGPAGPVEVRTVDNATPHLVGYMPPGGIVIPVAPLAADATYTASATFQPLDGEALSRTWSFATGSAAPPAVAPATPGEGGAAGAGPAHAAARLQLSRPRPSSRAVTFTLSVDRALVGRPARVSVMRLVRSCDAGACRLRQAGHAVTSTIARLSARQAIRAPRPAAGRAIRVLVRTQAFARGAVTYAAAKAAGRWAAR